MLPRDAPSSSWHPGTQLLTPSLLSRDGCTMAIHPPIPLPLSPPCPIPIPQVPLTSPEQDLARKSAPSPSPTPRRCQSAAPSTQTSWWGNPPLPSALPGTPAELPAQAGAPRRPRARGCRFFPFRGDSPGPHAGESAEGFLFVGGCYPGPRAAACVGGALPGLGTPRFRAEPCPGLSHSTQLFRFVFRGGYLKAAFPSPHAGLHPEVLRSRCGCRILLLGGGRSWRAITHPGRTGRVSLALSHQKVTFWGPLSAEPHQRPHRCDGLKNIILGVVRSGVLEGSNGDSKPQEPAVTTSVAGGLQRFSSPTRQVSVLMRHFCIFHDLHEARGFART